MNKKHKLLFSILMIFVLCLSASAIYAAEDDDASIAESQDDNIKIAESQDYDAISTSDVENIETETVDNDVGELSSPAESEILSEDKIDTSNVAVKVVNGSIDRTGEVLLDFSEICDDWYNTPISSDDTYLTINGETITGVPDYYHRWDYGAWYIFYMPELEEGPYPFTIHYGGNYYYTANEFSGTYYVTKIPLHVGIYPHSVKESNNGTIEVWIYDDVYRDDSEPWLSYSITDATLIVNNKEYKFNVQASNCMDEGILITIDSLPAGNYDVSFKFAGDDNYLPVEEFVADKQFSVISKDNKANIENIYAYGHDAYKGYNLTINYEIYGKVDGIEMDGNVKIILVDSDENEYEYLGYVDEDGEGSINLGWNLSGGIYTFKVQYMGNDYYDQSELITVGDWDEIPVELTIYDENNKKRIYPNLKYDSGFLKGENTTFNVSIDEYDQICDIPFTGKVKIILTNSDDNDDVFEYIIELDENGKGSIDLGCELTGSEYSIDVKYLDDPVYSYEDQYLLGFLTIYSEDNKVEIYYNDISCNVKCAFKTLNGTVTLNFTNTKKGNIPFVDGTATILLREMNEEEYFEYILDIIDDIATVDLGFNYNFNEYNVIITNLESKYYSLYGEGRLNSFYIYDEEHKAPVDDIMSSVNDTVEGRNATIFVDISNSKVSDKPLTGNMKLILFNYDNDNEYEYLIDIDENGKGSIDLGYNLTCGEYRVSVLYLGNDYYKEPDYEAYLDYLNIYGEDYKADIGRGLNYNFSDIPEGENTTITLDLSPYKILDLSLDGTLNITLVNNKNENEYYYLNDYVVDDSGKCIFELGDDLPIGKYYFIISYSGNNYYNPDSFVLCEKSYYYFDDGEIDWDWETVYINVVENTIAPKEATSLTASNVNINANPNSGYFKVTLKSNGAALAGQNVTITFNGKSYTALTDKNGVASFKLSSGIAKKYPVAISFKGNDKYLGSTANAYVTIKKNNVKFSKATKKVKKSKAKKAKFKITLKTSNNKVLAKKLVYIKINKKTYKAKTNAKGVATFKLKLPKKKKTYKYKVTFKGDKANNKKTFSKKLTVK